jgi:arylsulfatase A-like enzyme
MANDALDTQSLIKKGLLGALAYGLAMSLVHMGQGVGLILALGMPPFTSFVIQGMLMDLVLATAIAAAFTPLHKFPHAQWTQPVCAAVTFIILERIVAVDPSKIQMWVAPAIVSLVVYAIGRAIWSKSPKAVYGLAIGLPIVLASLPVIANNMREDSALNFELGEAPADAPDVLMIVMDTVRSQSVSGYGYERPTTPNLDKVAEEGLVFLDASAPATWSLPAHASLFTGTFPSWNNAHGETRYLDSQLPTMAEFLVQAGWESRCFSANPHISDSFGLTRGFMYNDKAWMAGTSGRNFSFIYRMIDALGLGAVDDKGGAQVVGNIEDWMDTRPDDSPPSFVFVNFLEAHFPFRQLPADFRDAYQNADSNTLREIDQIAFGVQFGRQLSDEEMEFVHQPLVDLYDGGVQYTDYLVGKVLDVYREAGRLDNTVVVILGDHGEVVGEHGAFGHVTPVLEQDLRVPLVFRYPPAIEANSRVEMPVSTVGTFATVMDLVDVAPPPILQITSLMPALDGEEVGLPILAERFEEEMLAARFAPGTANGTGEQVNPHGRYRTYRSGDYKLVQHSEDGTFLFNLAKDPGENHDVAAIDVGPLADLERELEDWAKELGLPDLDAPIDMPRDMPQNIGAAEIEALQALGYME